LRVWNLTNGASKNFQRKEASFTGMKGSLNFSPDGRLLVSAGTDRTISVWDVESGKEVKRIGTFPTFITAATFAPDGKSIFVSSGAMGTNPKTKERSFQGCCIVQVETATGRVLAYWDELSAVPFRHLFLSNRELLTALGGTLKKWTPENGKTVP
jgi:WD40 repeat protein